MDRKGSRSLTSGDGNPLQMDSIAIMQKQSKDETNVIMLLQKAHNFYAKGILLFTIIILLIITTYTTATLPL